MPTSHKYLRDYDIRVINRIQRKPAIEFGLLSNNYLPVFFSQKFNCLLILQITKSFRRFNNIYRKIKEKLTRMLLALKYAKICIFRKIRALIIITIIILFLNCIISNLYYINNNFYRLICLLKNVHCNDLQHLLVLF